MDIGGGGSKEGVWSWFGLGEEHGEGLYVHAGSRVSMSMDR